MAKKKTKPASPELPPGDAESQQINEQPEVRSAADALRAAQEELRKAQARYHDVRQQAAQKVEEIRETTVGEVVDGALEVVRKYPGPSLLAALAFGFMLDRWLRK